MYGRDYLEHQEYIRNNYLTIDVTLTQYDLDMISRALQEGRGSVDTLVKISCARHHLFQLRESML